MKLRAVAAMAVAALLATACGAQGADELDPKEDSSTTAVPGSTDGGGADEGASNDGKFGSLESPCGDGNATIKAEDAGLGADKLRIGVANNREGLKPGLLKELWDASSAFVEWCNAQGGIGGIELEAVDLVTDVMNVEDGMAKACSDVFAMVGGGYAMDHLLFSGKPDSDFHECGMIAFPGFAVSTDFSEASDQIQVLPNPAHQKPYGSYMQLKDLYPDLIENFGSAYGELASIEQNKDQVIGQAKEVEGYGNFTAISYPVINADFSVITQQIRSANIQLLSFVGEYVNFAALGQSLRDQGWEGVLTADANQYDNRLIESQGPAAVEGVAVRIATHPFEEADKWPATKQLMEILDQYTPDWEHAGLTVQSFSANLLFATAAKACADQGEISRVCVLQEGQKIDSWTGGGLHAEGNPAANEPAKCAMLVTVKDGKFTRLHPEIGSEMDTKDGFYCDEVVELEGNFGEGNKSKSILGS